MHVLKFGGTSMGDETTWHSVLDIIAEYKQPVIVVSATARTTRQLVKAAQTATQQLAPAREIAERIRHRHIQLIQKFLSHHAGADSETIAHQCRQWIEQCIDRLNGLLAEIARKKKCSPLYSDAVASIGEQLSAYLFAQCGVAYGLPTRWVDAQEIIKTDSTFGHALPDRSKINHTIKKIADRVDDHLMPVMGGFYGSDAKGQITTLGFEGSDYTASLVGAALQAQAIEIWTDVSGIFTCDPRVVPDARSIAELSFQEATELAYFGAKVLHPSTMKPANAAQIPVYVKNIFEPSHPGTKIHGSQTPQGWAKALTYLKDVIIVTVTANGAQEGPQFLAAVFEALNSLKLPVNAVMTTEASVSVALQANSRAKALQEKMQMLGTVTITKNQGLISLIGCNFGNMGTIQQQVLQAVTEVSPSLISYSKNKRNLNIAISDAHIIPAVRRIHNRLFANQDSDNQYC